MGHLEFAVIFLFFADKSIFTQSVCTVWCVDNMQQCGHACRLWNFVR